MRVRVPVTTERDIAVTRGEIRNEVMAVLEQAKVVFVLPTAAALAE